MLSELRSRGRFSKKEVNLVFLLGSITSVISSIAIMVWFTAGFRGVFWIAYGNAQIWYFAIVAGAILASIYLSWYFVLKGRVAVVACALGGYMGSVLAYIALNVGVISDLIDNGKYVVLVRPFIFPYHLTFVLAALCSFILMFALTSMRKSFAR